MTTPTRDVSASVPPTWTEYLRAHSEKPDAWVESAYDRATEKARQWAQRHYRVLRPGVQEQVRLCFSLLEHPVVREEAMNRLLWIMQKRPCKNPPNTSPPQR